MTNQKTSKKRRASSGFAKISREEFDGLDLEAPIRDSQSVDCWSLANLYETASKQQAEADNGAAARVYDLVAQVTEMHFKPDDGAEPYGPVIVAPDGRRSMMPGDLRGEQSAVFAAIAPDIANPGLTARLADVTWLNDRKQSAMAKLAIDAYCEAVQAVLDGRSVFLDDNRSASSRDGRDMLARACRIAKATGSTDPEGTRLKKLVSDVIRNAFDRKDHNGFQNSAKIGLQFGICEPSELARNAETLAATKGVAVLNAVKLIQNFVSPKERCSVVDINFGRNFANCHWSVKHQFNVFLPLIQVFLRPKERSVVCVDKRLFAAIATVTLLALNFSILLKLLAFAMRAAINAVTQLLLQSVSKVQVKKFGNFSLLRWAVVAEFDFHVHISKVMCFELIAI